MKNLFLSVSIGLLHLMTLHSQERTVWKEMNKEYGYCGSSLILYNDNSYFFEEICNALKFSFSIGEWKKKDSNIKLKPTAKKSITFKIIKSEETSKPDIKVVDINNEPIYQFDFIAYPKEIPVEEVVKDMDEYLEYSEEVNMTEISSPLQTFTDGKTGTSNIPEDHNLLAYDFYQITGEYFIIDSSDLPENYFELKINLPKEIFLHPILDFFELPGKKLMLENENYSFVK